MSDLGFFKDVQFWKDLGTNARNFNPYASLQRFGQIPDEADTIANREFPGSARDASTKNAFRHALGTGMMTQQLGGGPVAGTVAKGAGYLWEALGARNWAGDVPGYRDDTRHDLNANAIGASVAQQTGSQEELINALRGLATQARQTQPPGVFEASPGYMTRSVR
jgi:hypothetical protein